MTLAATDLTLPGRLSGVSLSLAPGSITAICGPNGAGKSTLLEALAGLLPVTGEVTLGGFPLPALSRWERARRIGYLPQSGEVAWNLSVRALAALGRLPYGDGAAAPVDSALRALDLADLADRPLSTLSGGERARALLARVLAGEPEWILADEPLAALDLAHQLALLSVLRGAAKGGAGVVLVLHDLALAMNHADHVVLLDNGAVAREGKPEEALAEREIARVWGVKTRWEGAARRGRCLSGFSRNQQI